ncbi:MAG TPA: AAA family ATPase [Phycisphaerae bacterium]|nr:AAA family ATPase [Phycisphaerae bacterium]
MRVVVTGQVGLDKAEFLAQTAAAAERMGRQVAVYNVGEMMYAEAPDVPQGRILNLPLSRLTALRRSVFKDVLAQAARQANVIVNTHATFRWRHGLFYGFDHDIMKELDADLYVVLVDNIDRVHARLRRDGHTDHNLKDLMVWREEETLATELLAEIVRGHGRFYILARGIHGPNPTELAKLIFAPQFRKAYLSFPMSNVVGDAAVAAEIHRLRTAMRKYFTCFDPGDLEEKPLAVEALAAAKAGRRLVTLRVDGREVEFETAELVGIIPDIDGQIYARDFKLIDQSDMIISLIPGLPGRAGGGPARAAISSGVERELQHAHEAGKDVFVIWPSAAPQSPFVTETATAVFESIEEAIRYFAENGYIPEPSPGGLFA